MIQLVSRHACEFFVSCRAPSLTSKIAARKNSDGSVISALAYSCFGKQERGTYHTWQSHVPMLNKIYSKDSASKSICLTHCSATKTFRKQLHVQSPPQISPENCLGPSDWVRRHFWDLKKLSPNLRLGCLQASGTASERHCAVPVMLWQEPETSYTILQPRRD